MTHALIVGPRGVGKSTLIRRVLTELGRPVFGFETRKEDRFATESEGSPVYIYQAGQPHFQRDDNLVGWSGNKDSCTTKAAFDRYAPKLRMPIPEDHIILLDELGFMEASSEDFCEAVLALLDGDIPVIAAVKDKNIPFLEEVRSHPKGKCFYISEENRDERFLAVLDYMKTQLNRKDN